MTNRDKRIFGLLKTLALSGEFVSNAALAAAIVYKGEIIAFGQNSYKSHPFQARFARHPESVYLHAETNAIYNALKKLTVEEIKKTSLYVLRVKRDGTTGLAKPCAGCARCISTFQIKNFFYTDDNGEFINAN